MIRARRAVARARPVASATAVSGSAARPVPKAVRVISPRAIDSTNSGPSSCLDARIQVAWDGPGAVSEAASAAGPSWGARSASSMAETVSRSRGSTAPGSASALSRLVWLTTLSAQTGRPSASRTGAATATSPGSMS